uniref:Queuine trna-ribosyltransferase n=1 Tax=Tetraselmis sp. GSL018 TaxID=582737 RepID=A0A061QNN3_9CHLO
MLLTPEHSMRIQNRLGADIIMALDDVVPSTNPTYERFKEATHRTTRWIDRCMAAHSRPREQNLFAIVQGGLDEGLRDISLRDLIARDLPGYAIGGLAGGEDKLEFIKVVNKCAPALPAGKPRYVMGIGYPLDVVLCSAARFGVALVDEGVMKLKNAAFERDMRPIDEECSCECCAKYTRAYCHNLAGKSLTSAAVLITLHNIAYMQRLTRRIRSAITEQRFPEFVRGFVRGQYPKGDEPEWVRFSLECAGISM